MTNELPICSVSGGKDSTLLYCLMKEFLGDNFLPIFADTGNEHPVTVNYVRNLHVMAGGPEVVIVKTDFTDKLKERGKPAATGNPFLDMMMWKGRAPSSKAQFCTEWVKLYPQLLYLQKHYPYREWIMYTGIRAAESPKRAAAYPTPFTWNSYFDCEYILPLLYVTEDQVWAGLQSFNVPPNPLYALGFGRVGCFPCIHSNKVQLSLLPDWAWDKLEEWERIIGRTWFPPDLVPGVHLCTVAQAREWCRTSWGGKQYDMFKSVEVADAPACLSTWGICE